MSSSSESAPLAPQKYQPIIIDDDSDEDLPPIVLNFKTPSKTPNRTPSASLNREGSTSSSTQGSSDTSRRKIKITGQFAPLGPKDSNQPPSSASLTPTVNRKPSHSQESALDQKGLSHLFASSTSSSSKKAANRKRERAEIIIVSSSDEDEEQATPSGSRDSKVTRSTPTSRPRKRPAIGTVKEERRTTVQGDSMVPPPEAQSSGQSQGRQSESKAKVEVSDDIDEIDELEETQVDDIVSPPQDADHPQPPIEETPDSSSRDEAGDRIAGEDADAAMHSNASIMEARTSTDPQSDEGSAKLPEHDNANINGVTSPSLTNGTGSSMLQPPQSASAHLPHATLLDNMQSTLQSTRDALRERLLELAGGPSTGNLSFQNPEILNAVIDDGPGGRFSSIWAQAVNGLSRFAGSVGDDGATNVDAMGQIFLADEEAIADMANLRPCSAQVIERLRAAGLKTTLKNHQSSGLKFLVDSEHRSLPRPREGEVCLWRATKGGRGRVTYFNIVTRLWNREPKLPRGAILSDAMGLGKTLTILALILTPDDGDGIVDREPISASKGSEKGGSKESRDARSSTAVDDSKDGKTSAKFNSSKSAHKGEKIKKKTKKTKMPSMGTPGDLDSDIDWSSSSEEGSDDEDSAQRKLPTLIVCPLSVVSNWVEQARIHLDSTKFKLGVLHGAEGIQLQQKKNWCKYNAIVTTYDVLAWSYRHLALLKGHQRREAKFDEKISDMRDTLEEYEKKTDPPNPEVVLAAKEEIERTEQHHAKLRLVCPTIDGRTDFKKTDICLDRARKYRRSGSNDDLKREYPNITDENDLLYCWSGRKRKPDTERVFKQVWKRVVLDEAHIVRNPSTIAYGAVVALQSDRRHAVTGTPLINKTNDIGSLAAWIGVSPYAGQDNQTLWNSSVENSIKKQELSGIRILRSITKSLVCLRTKEMRVDGKPLVELPPMTVNNYKLDLRPEDRVFYDNAETALRHRIVQMVEENEFDGIQSCILVFLARMRQLANDRRLVPGDLIDRIASANLVDPPSPLPGQDNSDALTAADVEDLQERLVTSVEMLESCPICLDGLTRDSDPVITWCKHIFHRICLEECIASNPSCPLDRGPLLRSTKLIGLPAEDVPDTFLHEEGSIDGAKINAIIEITRMVEASGDDKVIVFSNFTGLLKLIEGRLSSENIPFVTFYGSHTKLQRDVALASFARPLPPSCKVAPPMPDEHRIAPGPSRSALLDILDQSDLPSLCTHPTQKKSSLSSSSSSSSSSSKPIPRVILMSIGAGSVGINLTAASHVILADPWWQSAIEEQAFARAHRLGQAKPVKVYRLISSDTVEERVVSIAEEKAQLSSFALQGVTFEGKALFKASDSQSARLRDLGTMFGMSNEQMARMSRANRFRR